MIFIFISTFVSILSICDNSSALQTNYELYTGKGIKTGLSVNQPYFTLNGERITIFSGAIHYWRVPQAYWRDRLRKLRAAGFNTVETYIPWNLHEPQSGVYDFGYGGNDMSDFLHLELFLQLAKKEDLFVIIRSGPFICAEYEFGGFPSWLLRESGMTVRSSNAVYMKYVTRWFNVLLPLLAKNQFTKGGPILMFQVENEYAITGGRDKTYLKELRDLMLNNGIVEVLSTADNPWKGTIGTIPELFFMTGNFDTNPQLYLDELKGNQSGKPVMVMEFWTGWFDYIGQSHQTKALQNFEQTFEAILSYPASVNLYMFIGGTNFGFTSGAQNLKYDDWNTEFSPMTTSYDYSAPLAENGDYTDKYYSAQKLIAKYNQNPTILPDMPSLVHRKAYDSIKIEKQIYLGELLPTVPYVTSKYPTSQEVMNINNGNGQSYGYTVYRKVINLPANSYIKIQGRICDTLIVIVNGKRVSPILATGADLNKFGTWRNLDSYYQINTGPINQATIDLFVENWGRVNIGVYKQYKGLWQGNILINDVPTYDWTQYALEFKSNWVKSLSGWREYTTPQSDDEPKIYKATLNISGTPRDTYVHMENWVKGIVMVNGFNIGRYSHIGPQQALYLPAPFLKEGVNEILVFDQFTPNAQVDFVTDQIYKNY